MSPLASSPRRRFGSHGHLRAMSPLASSPRRRFGSHGHLRAMSPLASSPRRRFGSHGHLRAMSPLASSPRRRFGSHYHSSRDSTGRPARRVNQVLMRAIRERAARLSRVGTRNRRELGSESTFGERSVNRNDT